MKLLLILLLLTQEYSYTKVRVFDIDTKTWSDYNTSTNTFEFLENGNVRHVDVNGRIEIYKRISNPTINSKVKSYFLLTKDKFKIVLKLYPDHILVHYPGGEEAEFKN